MSLIYVDRSALLLSAAEPGVSEEHVAPGAHDAVEHLVEAGFEVIVLADEATAPELPRGVQCVGQLPEHLDPDTWYLTGEPNAPFGRPRGGTTVLVGPRRPQGKLPQPRFDLETRDMASAAMEILTREAMA